MSKIITAIFYTRAEVDAALSKLESKGFTKDQVSLLLSDESRGRHFKIVEDSKSEEGAVAGAALGGLAGAVYLGLASAGTILVPGLNVIVSGALLGTLAGLGAGATVGGLIGALVGMGIPEHEAKLYEDSMREGGILVAVDAKDDQEETVKRIFKDANAQSIRAVAA